MLHIKLLNVEIWKDFKNYWGLELTHKGSEKAEEQAGMCNALRSDEAIDN